MVHPVPTPELNQAVDIRRRKDGGSSQKLMLFRRGKAISGAPSISGTSQFPNPPIMIGITMKKIMVSAWYVMNMLYSESPPEDWPGWISCIRTSRLVKDPVTPDKIPNRK